MEPDKVCKGVCYKKSKSNETKVEVGNASNDDCTGSEGKMKTDGDSVAFNNANAGDDSDQMSGDNCTAKSGDNCGGNIYPSGETFDAALGSDKPVIDSRELRNEELYPKIGNVVKGEKDDISPMEIESLCMNCELNGFTRLMMIEIPFFRQVIIMSFRCEHCGYSNNEVKPGSVVQPMGGSYTLKCLSREDLQRQVVKSDEATVRFEELGFEIPSGKGVLTTIEGLLTTASGELQASQPQRRVIAPEIADQVDAFLSVLEDARLGNSIPLTVVIDDPTGNSFLENPSAPNPDPNMSYRTYRRTREMQQMLGLQTVGYEDEPEGCPQASDEVQRSPEDDDAATNGTENATVKFAGKSDDSQETQSFVTPSGGVVPRDASSDSTILDKEVYELPTECPICGTTGSTKSYVTDIPYFQAILIMGFDCKSESCGYKTNEVKGVGPVPSYGRSVCLHVAKKGSLEDEPRSFEMDLNRDVVKSNTAGIRIRELELEVTPGSLGGCYTTIEGLLTLIKKSLFEGQASDFCKGDSAEDLVKSRFEELEARFEALLRGEEDFHVELFDPLASSYIYSPSAPDPEPRLHISDYERSHEENEDLGLLDIKVENYETNEIEIAKQSSVECLAMPSPNDCDRDDGFEGPFATFDGHRLNKVFRLGKYGLGYYKDSSICASTNIMESMRNVQLDGAAAHPNPFAVQENERK